MTRLTFVGDIALDKPLLRAAKERGGGSYDFGGVFRTAEVFKRSDLVIGNLETCFGGGSRFNKKPYHYNSPDSFCQAIKNAGIGLVSTANNHCMDEGEKGLARTLRQLDACGIEHTGTFLPGAGDRYLVKELNGLKIAFYALTYSVNNCLEAHECDDLYRCVNLTGFSRNRQAGLKRTYRLVIKPRVYRIVKKVLKQSTIAAHTDAFRKEQINESWMADIERQIAKAKSESDLLVVLLHSGGQFNIEPGDYSRYMMDKLCALGADVIIGNHSHTVQRAEMRGEKLAAYSLGGYCMSVSGEYLVHDCLPEYSLALHVDIDEKTGKFSCAATILKGTEDASGYLTVRESADAGAAVIAERCGLRRTDSEGGEQK